MYEAEPADLFKGVRENEVHHYGFPEDRLAPINAASTGDSQWNEIDERDRADAADETTTETTDSPEESVVDNESDDAWVPEPPKELFELGERLESNGATVTTERGGLVVEKLSDEYRVTSGAGSRVIGHSRSGWRQ
ncbi:hypothetical protein ZOD2009_09925 [Haladaptatus paucihalophilus DX253]|uniref:Uncharacterized protein n=1 Tax=Haladaptatus paucihalophilus DX253 TaxID=797209 RepID=E7QSX7_HALPU|nr:hypothetical protein [Haladaptatus paucihalophilus]EFW92366.1 hypothetical protein ZOD2009_09925 [Haladaptatus paucihalophilus DX253]